MQEIIECIIKNLVEDKASVSVKEFTENSELKYEIKVNEKRYGKSYRKKGKIAQSIRTVMKAIAAKENKK